MHYQLEQTTSDSIAMTMSDSSDNVIKESVSSTTLNDTVISTMVNHRMVTIDREADRVDFIVNEEVDMTLFSINAYVMFTFEIRAGNFIIVVSAMAMSAPGVDVNNMTNDERK
jgi:Cu(I)/Ag(I) efflux system membrane fusion protein